MAVDLEMMRQTVSHFWEELRKRKGVVYVMYLSWGIPDSAICERNLGLGWFFIDRLVQNFKRKDPDSLIPGGEIQVCFFFWL